jgi:hypothetical protein
VQRLLCAIAVLFVDVDGSSAVVDGGMSGIGMLGRREGRGEVRMGEERVDIGEVGWSGTCGCQQQGESDEQEKQECN